MHVVQVNKNLLHKKVDNLQNCKYKYSVNSIFITEYKVRLERDILESYVAEISREWPGSISRCSD